MYVALARVLMLAVSNDKGELASGCMIAGRWWKTPYSELSIGLLSTQTPNADNVHTRIPENPKPMIDVHGKQT